MAVAAAIAVDVDQSTVSAYVPITVGVSAQAGLTIAAVNNTDGVGLADGSAVGTAQSSSGGSSGGSGGSSGSSKVGIGVAVGIVVVTETNDATLGSAASRGNYSPGEPDGRPLRRRDFSVLGAQDRSSRADPGNSRSDFRGLPTVTDSSFDNGRPDHIRRRPRRARAAPTSGWRARSPRSSFRRAARPRSRTARQSRSTGGGPARSRSHPTTKWRRAPPRRRSGPARPAARSGSAPRSR